MASSKETYCLCGQPYNIGQFMIECDCCREWFHGSCVNVRIYQSDDIDKYHCPKCAQTYGPSVLKIPTNSHRADRYEVGAEARPAQTGTPAWVRALAARPHRHHPAAVQTMRGAQFTEEFVKDNGFSKPLLFHSSEGLDLKVPSSPTFNARSVLRYCGAQLEVEVIDVRKQSTLRMPLGEFVDYLETPQEARDEKVLNVISLEFSETNMRPLVEPPAVARWLDWSASAWPSSEPPPRPSIQRYCLMSAAGAYTDWHVDFGGTTVWYHVMQGKKIFYLAPPTATNLALYQQWSAANNQSQKFFGDMVEWYGTVELRPGSSLLIPSGWPHAVLTPVDSLVLGGNLLHSYAIEMQLQIYEIERRVEMPTAFRYPLFEHMHWFAGAHLLTVLRRHNEESQDEDFIISENDIQAPQADLPPLLLRGIKILANALKEWHALKSTDTMKRDNVPKCLNSGQLVRELCKELRALDKRHSTTKDKDFKPKSTSPTKSHTRKAAASKKSIKLTLPKPIMHMAQNEEFIEQKPPFIEKQPYVDNKEIIFQDQRYMNQDIKYIENGLTVQKNYIVENKELVLQDKSYMYQSYDELPVYSQDSFGDIGHKKNGPHLLRIKMDNSPSSSRDAPPPYTLPEHSILKSHLIGRPLPSERLPPSQPLKPIQQWTISKKDVQGDYQEEQILFTNENLQTNVQAQDLNYGPGMYSAEDITQDYQYSSESAKPGSYLPEYGYPLRRDQPYAYSELPPEHQNPSSYPAAPLEVPYPQHDPLPSYETAITHQYHANTYPPHPHPHPSVPQPHPPSPSSPPAPRRSSRAPRRRLSTTYEYEDQDLYVHDAPQPRRNKRPKAKVRATVSPSSSYLSAPAHPAPANGIESLIQASVLAEEEPPTATEDAAVAGMLSISGRYAAPHRTFGLAAGAVDSGTESTPGGRSRKKPPPPADDDDDEEEEDIIREVHRDDEYVYPSLEMSSDEEEEWSSRRRQHRTKVDSRNKSEKDEPWAPRGRVGRLTPRLRSGRAARREAVRAVLTHARGRDKARLRNENVAHEIQNAKRAVLAAKSKKPPQPVPTTPNKNNARLKKGMKTAKQRLGKILKIHKMIY